MNPRLAAALCLATVGAGTLVAARPDAPQGGARATHVVFVTGDDEYRSEVTMPMIAAILEKRHGFSTAVAYARPTPQTNDNIEGLQALERADVMVLFTRFRALPEDQLQAILRFTRSGKGLVGLRTSTHAFRYPQGHARQALNDSFGADVFGQRWITHHGSRSHTDVSLAAHAATHPVLHGVGPFRARSWLYHVAPLQGETTILLDGTAVNSEKAAADLQKYPTTQPVAWTREYQQSRVFFTTLGHPEDFAHESMRRLLVNGIYWAAGREVPAGGADASTVGPYEPPETFDLSQLRRP
jgi:uncharacterized protein